MRRVYRQKPGSALSASPERTTPAQWNGARARRGPCAQLELRVAEGLGRGPPRAEVPVEAPHQLRGRGVGDAPQRHGHGVGAGVEEGPGDAHDALPVHDLAEAGVAGRERDEPGPEREGRDLAHLEQAVLALAGREHERRAARRAVVVGPVGGEVQRAVGRETGACFSQLSEASLPRRTSAAPGGKSAGDLLHLAAGRAGAGRGRADGGSA